MLLKKDGNPIQDLNKSAIVYRRVSKEDIPSIVAMVNVHYITKKTVEYYVWRYVNSIMPTIFMGAYVEDKIVGIFGLQQRVLSNQHVIAIGMDNFVDRKWRGQRIAEELLEQGIKHLGKIDAVIGYQNILGRNWSEKTGTAKVLGKILTLSLDVNQLEGSLTKKSISHKINNVSLFLDYSQEFLQWRFYQHPYYQYHKISLSSGDFIMTKVFIDSAQGVVFGDLVYIHCDLNNPHRIQQLLLKACDYFRERNVQHITIWSLKDSVLYGQLVELGFNETSAESYFCVKLLDAQQDYLYDFNSWHLAQADSELF